MPVEDYGGLTLHTQVLGDPAHPAAVLVHGLVTGSLSTWYFTVAPALASDHRVVMYDMRGHGMSPRAGTAWGVRAHADDLARVIERHGGDRPLTLVGHSVGGAIALRYALTHPARVAGLVLVDTPLPLLTREWIAHVRGLSPAAMLALLPPSQHGTLGRGGRQATRLVTQVLALVNQTTLLDDLLAEPDFADGELATLAMPLRLCYATGGVEQVTATGTRLAHRVPNARLTMIEGSHFLPIEAGPAVAAAIRGSP